MKRLLPFILLITLPLGAQRIASSFVPPAGTSIGRTTLGTYLYANVSSLGNLFMNGSGSGVPSIASTSVPPVGAMVGLAPNGNFLYVNVDANGNLFTDNSCTGCAGSLTTAQCLAAAAPIGTPCTASSGQANGLGVAGTSGTITLYTANAVANSTFQICPNIVVDVAGTAGTVQGSMVTWITPGNATLSGFSIGAIANLNGVNTSQYCNTVSPKAASTLAFVITTTGATGTPTWEYNYVVTRLN